MTQAHKQWIKNKTPLLREYTLKKRALLTKAAGNNYSKLPGWVYGSYNDLELEVKLGLSELNFKILSEMVEQDLKRSGLDYDIAYKNAVITWEATKAELLAAWEQELADLKLSNDNSDNELKLLAIEIAKRGIALLEAKTALDLEAEGIRKQIAELDGQTGSYEIQLAQARLVTAQRKLEVIPIIQQLIVLEQQALAKEWLIVSKNQEIIDKQNDILVVSQLIVDKTYDLLPKQYAILAKDEIIIGKEQELITKNEEILAKEEEIIVKHTEVANKSLEVVAKDLEVVTKKGELLTKEEEVLTKEEEVIAKSLEILLLLEQIANTKNAIADQQDTIIAKAYTVMVAEQALIDAEYLVLDARESRASAEADVVTAEEDYASDRIAKITPALEALLTALDGYITEIQAQTVIYADIVSTKQQITDLQLLEATKADEILTTQYSLLAKITEIANETKNLALYKQAQLAPNISNLVVKLQEYSAELVTQTALEKSIIDAKVELISLAPEESAIKLDIAEEEVLTAAARQEVAAERDTKDMDAISFRVDSMTKKAGHDLELVTQELADISTIAAERSLIDSLKQQLIYDTALITFAEQLEHIQAIEGLAAQIIANLGSKEVQWIAEKTAANIAPKITATLRHLLGSE